MRALEVFDFKYYLSGQSDHRVDALDGTSESMTLEQGLLRAGQGAGIATAWLASG